MTHPSNALYQAKHRNKMRDVALGEWDEFLCPYFVTHRESGSFFCVVARSCIAPYFRLVREHVGSTGQRYVKTIVVSKRVLETSFVATFRD